MNYLTIILNHKRRREINMIHILKILKKFLLNEISKKFYGINNLFENEKNFIKAPKKNCSRKIVYKRGNYKLFSEKKYFIYSIFRYKNLLELNNRFHKYISKTSNSEGIIIFISKLIKNIDLLLKKFEDL